MKYASNLNKLILTSFIVCTVTMPVFAIENGIYTTTTITNYVNPDTGFIDDGGTQNAAIGEGMCRSIIDPLTLIEIENDQIYATIRMHLYENIPDVNFKIQGVESDPDSYYEISHEVVQEDSYEDFADLRFQIPKTGVLIQCRAYITPMGREVCFYIEIEDNLTDYSGDDFIISITENETHNPNENIDENTNDNETHNENDFEETKIEAEEDNKDKSYTSIIVIMTIFIISIISILSRKGKKNVT